MNPMKILCHSCLVLSGLVVTLFILDRFNPTMEYLSSSISKGVLLFFALLVMLQTIMSLIGMRKSDRAREKKKRKARH